MGYSDRLVKFNCPGFIPEGWFWLLRSADLKRGQAKAIEFAGRDMAVYRGADGGVRAMDAYCPHMGAHLGDGIVAGNNLKCLFHNWDFDSAGRCVNMPGKKQSGSAPSIRTYKASEKYGLIWLWTGSLDTTESIPAIPELAGLEVDAAFGNRFIKNCHPNVVMINAIDANHFNTVHNLVLNLKMDKQVLSPHAVRFHNSTRVPKTTRLARLIGSFYAGPLTYDMTYWYGHTGSVTLGPDFLHFYIIFALRPLTDGRTEGQTILVTKKRRGVFGTLVNRFILALTTIVGNYFAKGDTIIFSKIKFNFKTPTAADQAIIEFIEHYEMQKPSAEFSLPQKTELKIATLSEERSISVSPQA